MSITRGENSHLQYVLWLPTVEYCVYLMRSVSKPHIILKVFDKCATHWENKLIPLLALVSRYRSLFDSQFYLRKFFAHNKKGNVCSIRIRDVELQHTAWALVSLELNQTFLLLEVFLHFMIRILESKLLIFRCTTKKVVKRIWWTSNRVNSSYSHSNYYCDV